MIDWFILSSYIALVLVAVVALVVATTNFLLLYKVKMIIRR